MMEKNCHFINATLVEEVALLEDLEIKLLDLFIPMAKQKWVW